MSPARIEHRIFYAKDVSEEVEQLGRGFEEILEPGKEVSIGFGTGASIECAKNDRSTTVTIGPDFYAFPLHRRLVRRRGKKEERFNVKPQEEVVKRGEAVRVAIRQPGEEKGSVVERSITVEHIRRK